MMENSELLPGVIRVEFNGSGVTAESVRGMAVISRNVPMSMDTMVWMASNGKTVTALAAMMLVEQGAFSLDDPVCKYLPHFKRLWVEGRDGSLKPAQNEATIRHMLAHTSGLKWLPGFFQERELSYISLESSTHIYAASPLLFEPGTSSNYSNAGFNIVGRIIEVVSGMPYEEFVRRNIFQPLGMNDTGYFLAEEQAQRLACGYRYLEDGTWEEVPVISQMTLIPLCSRERYAECGGGLFSTANDMLKLAQAIAGKDSRLLAREESFYEMARNQRHPSDESKYGLGSLCENDRVIGHGGAWGTSLKVDLDAGCGTMLIVQRCNEWPQWLLDGKGRTIGMQSAAERI